MASQRRRALRAGGGCGRSRSRSSPWDSSPRGIAGVRSSLEERVVPVVTAVDEQHAVLALALYRAEAGVADELAQRRKDPRPGNARRLRAAATAGVATVESALARACAVSGADPLATAYTDDPGHARLLDVLAALGRVEPDAPSAERERSRLLAAVTTPAADRLRAYLLGLPADLLAGLREHPSAGPALRAIEHDRRQVTAR